MKVLAYHRVNNIDSDPLTVRTEMFLRQVDYLEDRHFEFISPKELCGDIAGPGTKKRCALLTFDHGFCTDLEVIYPLLKAKGYPAVFFLVTDLIGKKGMLSFDEARALIKSGFSIGSHTISHPRLTRIPLPEARREIEDSKKFLEDRLGEKIDYFAYPYGDFNEDIARVVKETGYSGAFFISPWSWRAGFSRFKIARSGIYQATNFLLFKLKVL